MSQQPRFGLYLSYLDSVATIGQSSLEYTIGQSSLENRKLQKKTGGETLLVTIPTVFVQAIPLLKSDMVKMTLENSRITMEKV